MTNTATILVWIMAGLVLLQTLGMVIAMEIAGRKISKARPRIDRSVERILELLQKTQLLIEKTLPVREKAPELERILQRLLESVSTSLERANILASEGIQTATENIEIAGRKMDIALAQFSRQTARVNKLVRYPTIQASAILQGAVAAFRELSRARQEGPARWPSDEEDFI